MMGLPSRPRIARSLGPVALVVDRSATGLPVRLPTVGLHPLLPRF